MSPRLLTPTRPSSSDAHLVRRAAAGDDDAYAALYARYEPRLYAYCRSIVRHDEDARDAVQNAMTKALVALRRDANTINVQAWLFRIAHNESITVLRRRRPTSELPDAVCDHALDPAGDVIVREELRATLEGLRALSGRLQQPLLLRELAGLSYGQVADVTGGTPAAARKAVFEARSALSADRQGRNEECSVIRQALSDGDGRRRRARIVRSHLRSCDACRSWEHDLRVRRQQLAATIPAAGVAAGSLWGWIAGLLSGSAGSSAVVGMAGGGMATNAKLAAAVLVVAAGATTPVVTQYERSERRAASAIATGSAGASGAAARVATSSSSATGVKRAVPASSSSAGVASATAMASSGARDEAAATSTASERRKRASSADDGASSSAADDRHDRSHSSGAPRAGQGERAGAASADGHRDRASGATGGDQRTHQPGATAAPPLAAGTTGAARRHHRTGAREGATASPTGQQVAERLPAARPDSATGSPPSALDG